MSHKVLLGVLGSDIHVVAITIFESLLTSRGHNIVNLGAMTPPADFIQAAKQIHPSAILVSSVYGHAWQDAVELMEIKQKALLDGCLFYIGGNLAIGNYNHASEICRFMNLGFDRVFSNNVTFQDVILCLERDLNLLKTESVYNRRPLCSQYHLLPGLKQAIPQTMSLRGNSI